MVLILLPLLCKDDNLILKLNQKKIATFMRRGFLWADTKLLGMINKGIVY